MTYLNQLSILIITLLLSLQMTACSQGLVENNSYSASSEDIAQLKSEVGSLSVNEAEYFLEVAMLAEYGSTGAVIKKWNQDIKIRILGEPTADDIDELNSIVSELNEILDDKIKISFTNGDDYNSVIMFVPQASFNEFSPIKVDNANGFVCVWKDSQGVITSSQILISTDLKGKKRRHVIREELTQSLGILNDSWLDSDSIFYQGASYVTDYSDLDLQILNILYSSVIKAGMGYEVVTELLEV